MRRVLITGGAGFIGSSIAERLQDGFRVVVFDNLSSGNRDNLENIESELVEGDVRDPESLEAACQDVEVIFHLAAQISVPLSIEDPLETVRINTLGTLNVLAAALKKGVKHIVLSSSAAVYGDNPTMPKKETMIPEPKSPYAVSKLDGEYYLKIFNEQYGIDTVSLRYFNVFGPRQDPSSAYAAVIPSFIHRCVNNEDLIIYGDGRQTRDFVYVKDVVEANILASESKKRKNRRAYNVACGRSISINELARTIIDITGSRSKVTYEEERPGDVKHSLADISLIQSDLKFNPDPDLIKGLEKTARFFLEHRTE